MKKLLLLVIVACFTIAIAVSGISRGTIPQEDASIVYELGAGRIGFVNGKSVNLDKKGDKVDVEVRNFKRYKANQKTTEWCWAACIQMVINQRDIEMSQDDVVSGVKGKIIIETASAKEINDFLNGWKLFDNPQKRWATNCFYKESPPDQNMMFRQLGVMQRPLIVSLKIPDEDEEIQHVVAVFKTRFIVGNDVESIVIYDPYDGSEVTLEWSKAKDRITGTWYPTVINNTYDRTF